MSKSAQISRREFLAASGALAARKVFAQTTRTEQSWLELRGSYVTVEVRPDLSLRIMRRADRKLLWRTSERLKPEVAVLAADSPGAPSRTMALQSATVRNTEKFVQGRYQGYRIGLDSFPNSDVKLELVLAMDIRDNELLVQVGQSGGRDQIQQINHLYRIEKPTTEGGYMVLPHGCGYLIPADTAQALTGTGIIGYRYTLPLFGMVKGKDAFYQIVETYWDCSVGAEHVPGEYSALDFNWLASLGELRYPRRLLWRFASGIDYVTMAKAYRKYAQAQGLVHTLEDKSKELPAVKRYVTGVEFRWTAWRASDEQAVLRDIAQFKERGLNVNFFFPKWSSTGYPDEQGYQADAGWQAFLRTEPVREGWKGLVQLADAAKSSGALIKVMINPNENEEGAPGYDPSRAPTPEPGKKPGFPSLSPHFGPEVTKEAIDHLLSSGVKLDALYFDGYSAHSGHGEDFSPEHPVTRKQGFEAQVSSFRETRRRGIIPGAELPRFWSMGECAFFFFDSGWSSDLLPVGDPVPLFQLVFRDCYAACFSGGGYGRYDWPRDRNPRLYELLFGVTPGYNWMLPYVDGFPGLGLQGGVPIREWGEERMEHRIQWLRRWSSYYQAIAYSEMVSHEFLNPERTLQRVQFAHEVTAEFDMAKGLCKIKGVPGFSGDWEKPHAGSL